MFYSERERQQLRMEENMNGGSEGMVKRQASAYNDSGKP
jgi:hypothetical protein